MFCSQCGSEIEQHFKFCSRCGLDLTPRTSEDLRRRKMAGHVRILGWIFIACGVLWGILGMVVIFAGQLLQRLPIEWPADIPVDAASLATSITAAVGIALVIVAGGIAAAGAGLLYYRAWGRVAGIIMGVIMLLEFPLGTAVGIYALWVLLSTPGREHYLERAEAGSQV